MNIISFKDNEKIMNYEVIDVVNIASYIHQQEKNKVIV